MAMSEKHREILSERMKTNNPNKNGLLCLGKPNPKASKRMKKHNPRHYCVDVWSKEIYQYDLEGNFIKKWNSMKEASLFCGKEVTQYKNCKSIGGFMWRLKFEGDKIEAVKKKTKHKVVSIYNKDGNIIDSFLGLKACGEFLKVSQGIVLKRIQKQKPEKGYFIKYGSEERVKIFQQEEKKLNRTVPTLNNTEILGHVGNCIEDTGLYYIYRHVRLDKNEPFYIGIGKKKHYDYSKPCMSNDYSRAFSKKGRNTYWKNIVNKSAGKYNVEILLESNDYVFIKRKELEFIDLYKRNCDGGILSNMTMGGEGTLGHTPKRTNSWKPIIVIDTFLNAELFFESIMAAHKYLLISRCVIMRYIESKKYYKNRYLFKNCSNNPSCYPEMMSKEEWTIFKLNQIQPKSINDEIPN